MKASTLRELLLATVDSDQRFEGFVRRVSLIVDLDPARVRALFRNLDVSQWASWVHSAPGIYFIPVDAGEARKGAVCRLVGLSADTHFTLGDASHEHWVFVLHGAARGVDGRVWYPGDLFRCQDTRVDTSQDQPVVFVHLSGVRRAPRRERT